MGGRRCTVCDHPEVAKINEAIVSGGSNRAIACRFELDRGAINRHRENHLKKAVQRGKELAEARRAEEDLSVLDQLRDLVKRAMVIMDQADGDPNLALRAMRELRANLELMSKLTGDLSTGGSVNVNIMNVDVRMMSDAELESIVNGDPAAALRG